MNRCEWLWVSDAPTSFHLGVIRCRLFVGGECYEYAQLIPKDYVLMRDRAGYFWHIIARMAHMMERAVCPT